MKFQAGDRFVVCGSSRSGRVLHAIKAPADPFEDYYTVEWDHLQGTNDYKCYTVDQQWEHELPHVSPMNKFITGAKATLKINGVPVGYAGEISMSVDANTLGESLQSCRHEYVPYHGLNESFEYCKHCDQRKV